MKAHSQFSLRELLFVFLFAGLGIASLRAGGVLASITIFLAFVLTMGLAILALLARERLRAFAIGFLVPVIMYSVVVFAIGASELDPYEGKLATSRLLLPVHQVVVEERWVDITTGEVVPDYQPATGRMDSYGGGGYGGMGMGSGGMAAGGGMGGMAAGGGMGGMGGGMAMGPPVARSEHPDRTTFMSIGHVLFAMLFGYAGAKFAIAVELRQRAARRPADGPV